MNKTVVADAVNTAFTLSAELSETLSTAAEKIADSGFDFRDGCEMVSGVFKVIKADNLLNFQSWEVVRKRFEVVAGARSRANGAADPDAAANECWRRCTGYLKEYHGLTKPKSEEVGSVQKAAKREAEKAKLVELSGGKSAAELQSDIRAMYGEASDESIAKAKALEKALKIVQSAEKDAVKAQVKPLKSAIDAAHKANLEFCEKHGVGIYSDYIVFLKDFIAGYEDAATDQKM